MRPISASIVGASALLCVASVVQWVTSYTPLGWAGARRGDVSYTIISSSGSLILQRARMSYPPPPADPGWHLSAGLCGDSYGPTSPSSWLEYVGLVDTSIRVPCEVDPTLGPNVISQSVVAAGHNLSLPSWMLVVVTGFVPLRLGIRLAREQGERQRRGFDVTATHSETRETDR